MSDRITISKKALEALKAGVAERARLQDALEVIAELGCIYSCDPAAYAIEVVEGLRKRVAELEAKLKDAHDFVGDSVIPLVLDNGQRLFATAVSGGADYVDGMPRHVVLVERTPEGAETEREYVQRLRCTACDDHPSNDNSPCAVCGKECAPS